MKDNLMVMNGEFGAVRTMVIGNEVWFVGKDIAECLGYSNTSDALNKHVEDEDKDIAKCDTLGGKQNLTIINESGLYSLVLSSKLPSAKQFKRWITSEVLPSIRKNGMYATDITIEKMISDPDFAIGLLTKLKEEKEKRKVLENKLEEQKPKVIFADSVESSKTSILIGDLAKLIKQNRIDMGQKRMFNWLRENGYLIKRNGTDYNMPTQKSMEMKLFEIKETAITHSDGHITINKTVKVTGKGQIYFINKFLKQKLDVK